VFSYKKDIRNRQLNELQTSSYGMLYVLCCSNILQIFWAVISLIAVLMIDLLSSRAFSKEGLCNKTMNEAVDQFSTDAQSHEFITSMRNRRF